MEIAPTIELKETSGPVTVPFVACYFRMKYEKTQPKHVAVYEKSGKK